MSETHLGLSRGDGEQVDIFDDDPDRLGTQAGVRYTEMQRSQMTCSQATQDRLSALGSKMGMSPRR